MRKFNLISLLALTLVMTANAQADISCSDVNLNGSFVKPVDIGEYGYGDRARPEIKALTEIKQTGCTLSLVETKLQANWDVNKTTGQWERTRSVSLVHTWTVNLNGISKIPVSVIRENTEFHNSGEISAIAYARALKNANIKLDLSKAKKLSNKVISVPITVESSNFVATDISGSITVKANLLLTRTSSTSPEISKVEIQKGSIQATIGDINANDYLSLVIDNVPKFLETQFGKFMTVNRVSK